VQTRRLADPFEPLNSSLAQSTETMALVRQPKTAGFRPKSRYEYIVHRFSKFGIKLLAPGVLDSGVRRKFLRGGQSFVTIV